MATNFKIKRSAVASKRPGTTDLELGELALNTYDGFLYSETTGAGSTVSLLTPWQEKYGQGSIHYTGGKVGIGTTVFDVDPSARLQVNGSIFMSGEGGGDAKTGIELGAGGVGVGTAHHRIRTAGGSGENLIFEAQTADIFEPGGDIVFKTGGISNRLRILKDGNIGIGTVSTDSKLEINVGTAVSAFDIQGSAGQLFSVTNNLTSGSIFSVNDVSGIPSIDVDADGTIQLVPFGETELVGIGTTNPTSKLHVVGDVRVGINTSQGIILTSPNGTSYRLIVDDSGVLSTTSV